MLSTKVIFHIPALSNEQQRKKTQRINIANVFLKRYELRIWESPGNHGEYMELNYIYPLT